MYRRLAVLLLMVLFCGGLLLPARAEVLDKISAVVDGHIITLSDIRKEHVIQTVLGDPAETDDALLKSLIDRQLLEEEMAQFPGLDVSAEEIDARMKEVTDLHGISPADIRNAISLKIQRRTYFNLRYRQFIVVTNDEIDTYYKTVFVPEAEKKGIAVPPLDQVTEGIRSNLFEEKLSSDLEASLESLRSRSTFEIF